MYFSKILQKHLLFLLFCVVATSACTFVIKPPQEAYTAYAPQEKIELKIGLNITDELRQANWEKSMPVGEWLAPNSVSLANHVFTNVIDIKGRSHDPGLTVDAVLTPKIVFINRTTGATSFGKSIITVKVEWDLSTPAGKPIWVETVSGEASGSTGWTDPDKILKEALHKLQNNTQQAFISSHAIKHFAASR